MVKATYADNQLNNLVLLRAVAVLMVCFCHFVSPITDGHYFTEAFKVIYIYGQYGVHVFFVISGFIIPLSLYKGKYDISNYLRFLFKRVLRLHPPYLAALALTLFIMFISYKQRNIVFPENCISIIKSLFYFHTPADNPVFWTLAVEAQYYIFIGIFYSLFIRNTSSLIILVVGLLLVSQTALGSYISLVYHMPFFLVGNICALLYIHGAEKRVNIVILVGILLFILTCYNVPAFIFSAITALLILKWRSPVPSLFLFLGKISYSIYLIHYPIGTKFINFIKPRVPAAHSWLLAIVTMLLVIVASWVFYKFFEEYAEYASKKIKYLIKNSSYQPGNQINDKPATITIPASAEGKL
ncbi:MAG: acyltransferase [Hymenobacter sp.]|nr:MAG: acyltransferase [Hymenobacter sp.]